MTEVRPAYDAGTGTWFLDTGEEARTVRELVAMLGPGLRVADYFPGGREVTSTERGYNVNEMRREIPRPAKSPVARPLHPVAPARLKKIPVVRLARDQVAVMRAARSGRRNPDGARLYDLEKILDGWYAGLPVREIVNGLGLGAKAGTVRVHLMLARERGDPRAVAAADPVRKANQLARMVAKLPIPTATTEVATTEVAAPTRSSGGCPFFAGDRVNHPTYGGGVVLGVGSINERRRDWLLRIRFDCSRHEQMMYSRVVQSAMRRAA